LAVFSLTPDPSPRGRGAKEHTRKFLLQYLFIMTGPSGLAVLKGLPVLSSYLDFITVLFGIGERFDNLEKYLNV